MAFGGAPGPSGGPSQHLGKGIKASLDWGMPGMPTARPGVPWRGDQWQRAAAGGCGCSSGSVSLQAQLGAAFPSRGTAWGRQGKAFSLRHGLAAFSCRSSAEHHFISCVFSCVLLSSQANEDLMEQMCSAAACASVSCSASDLAAALRDIQTEDERIAAKNLQVKLYLVVSVR